MAKQAIEGSRDKNMEQIKRIKRMKSYLDDTAAAISELSEALSGYEDLQDKYYELTDYYGSPDWWSDLRADEEDKLPDDLKRGVLSEDAVFDLITLHRELMTRFQKAVLRSME